MPWGIKKNGPQSIGKSRGGLTTKIHLLSANDRCALRLSFSPGNAHDGVEGRKLLSDWVDRRQNLPLVMACAYEGDETRRLALDFGFKPVVLPKSNRVKSWQYDKEIYKRRNEIERLFRGLKALDGYFLALRNLISCSKHSSNLPRP